MARSRQSERVSCASRLKVLADETRLAVVESLLKGPKCVGQINEGLGVEATLLSHHLRVLRSAGIVTAQRDGKRIVYRLTNDISERQLSERQLSERQQGQAIDLGCCIITFD